MKTHKASLSKKDERRWYQIDASKRPLGRVATSIAIVLRGKHRRDFVPNKDMGDFVVAVNVDRLKLTGRKVEQKQYYRHSGYLGGLKITSLKDLLQKKPEEVLRKAVYSMVDNVKFRGKAMSRLKMVKGSKHEFKIDKELN